MCACTTFLIFSIWARAAPACPTLTLTRIYTTTNVRPPDCYVFTPFYKNISKIQEHEILREREDIYPLCFPGVRSDSPMFELRAIDSDSQGKPIGYDSGIASKECRKTIVYCIVSIILFIAAFELSNPDVMQALPGGPATAMFIGIVIIIAVFVLCYLQRPTRLQKTT